MGGGRGRGRARRGRRNESGAWRSLRPEIDGPLMTKGDRDPVPGRGSYRLVRLREPLEDREGQGERVFGVGRPVLAEPLLPLGSLDLREERVALECMADLGEVDPPGQREE